MSNSSPDSAYPRHCADKLYSLTSAFGYQKQRLAFVDPRHPNPSIVQYKTNEGYCVIYPRHQAFPRTKEIDSMNYASFVDYPVTLVAAPEDPTAITTAFIVSRRWNGWNDAGYFNYFHQEGNIALYPNGKYRYLFLDPLRPLEAASEAKVDQIQKINNSLRLATLKTISQIEEISSMCLKLGLPLHLPKGCDDHPEYIGLNRLSVRVAHAFNSRQINPNQLALYRKKLHEMQSIISTYGRKKADLAVNTLLSVAMSWVVAGLSLQITGSPDIGLATFLTTQVAQTVGFRLFDPVLKATSVLNQNFDFLSSRTGGKVNQDML